MKDAFGRTIKVGDILVYATRHGSTQELNVAYVSEIVSKKHSWRDTEQEFVRAECIAGTGYDFKHGRSKWNGEEHVISQMTGRMVALRASHNMMIANGINVDEVVNTVQAEQDANIAEMNARKRARTQA